MMKYKKIFILIIAVLMIVGLSSCAKIKSYFTTADTDVDEKDSGFVESKENELFMYDVYHNYIAITDYKGEEPVVIIPETIDDKPVTTIAPLAFHGNDIPESIELPKTLTTIKANGFYCCTKLKELVIPDTVTFIGERAFAWCSAMTSITLPQGITEIPNYAFNNCKSLQGIAIPNTVTKIGERAFSFCASMKRIELPTSVTSIGVNAFINCTALEYAIIPSSVTEVGTGIFDDCPVLTIVADEGTRIFQYVTENSYIGTTERPPEESSEVSIDESAVETSVVE